MFPYPRFLRRSPQLLTGLDIGNSEIRLVELSRRSKHLLQLDRYACEQLPAGTISSAGIEDPDLLIRAAQNLWQNSGAQSRRIAIGMPAVMAITAQLTITASRQHGDEMYLQSLAQSHIAPSLPYPVEEARIDFFLQPPLQADHAAILLIAAVPLSTIDDHLALAEAMGLEVALITLGSYAEYTAWAHSHTRQTAQPVTAAAATSDLGNTTALLRIDADALQCTLFCDNRLTASLNGTAHEKISGQARAAADLLSATLAQTGVSHLDQLILTGTNAASDTLAAAIHKQSGCATSIATSIATPFAGMSFAADIDLPQLQIQAPAFLGACGLALQQSH